MTDFAVGDHIVDFESIYQIYKEKGGYFFYKPIFASTSTSISSLPVNNVAKSGFRHPISKEEIKQFFKLLSQPLDPTLPFEPKLTKEILYLNDPLKTIPILKLLSQNKIETAEKFARSNSEVMENIIKHLADEIAFVTKKSFKSIQSQILAILKKLPSAPINLNKTQAKFRVQLH